MTWNPLDERFQPPSEPEVIALCTYCGGEIYAGEPHTVYNHGIITHEGDCENGYVAAELGIIRVSAY